jgi:hypothetical protein
MGSREKALMATNKTRFETLEAMISNVDGIARQARDYNWDQSIENAVSASRGLVLDHMDRVNLENEKRLCE